MFQRLLTVLTLSSLLVLSGCSLFGSQTRITTEADSYALAAEFLENRNYNLAIEQLEAMEGRFPFGAYASQVQLDLIYAHYERRQYTRALRRANRFIRLQPAHPDVDYAYYMRGLITFGMAEERAGLLGTRNPVDRDVSGYDDTFRQMNEFLNRFPDSDYADNARGIMQVSRARMAEHSLNIAIYYYQIDRTQSALNRLQKVLAEFPGEPIQEDALALMVRIYEKMDDQDNADAALALLRQEFPDSSYIEETTVSADFSFRRPWYFWLTLGLVG